MLLPHHPEQDQFEKYPEDIQDLGIRFLVNYLWSLEYPLLE